MPPATIDAFRDHGVVRPSLEENLEGAKQIFVRLAQLGIDMDEVALKLQNDGVKLFADSFDTLMESISAKRR
jgi:transaldolase / glucose-6-phosphate isomerase